ncbi:unnamed protein product [Paramecium sonneborni]|uniref:MORN repeat protein n=1 Tax=Paramecium sonneborni TaxID=65129 RepID=A0A8S1RRM7_9CILI|nr:unnamed protein product [Paramecium sonneborni]
MNGMKIGRWDIMYKNDFEKGYQQIGGGSYDLEGNQKKIGKWTELDGGFDCQQQFTYNGEYNKNGMKVGKWDIISINYGEYEQIIQNKFSGGGQYDQEGNQQKIGKWTELDKKQFIHNGEYNMNGMKVGRWDIKSLIYGEYKQIGGGSYDQEGNQKKIGKWTELDEEFRNMKQITYNGEYNMNEMKIGRCHSKWLIQFERLKSRYLDRNDWQQKNERKEILELKQQNMRKLNIQQVSILQLLLCFFTIILIYKIQKPQTQLKRLMQLSFKNYNLSVTDFRL